MFLAIGVLTSQIAATRPAASLNWTAIAALAAFARRDLAAA